MRRCRQPESFFSEASDPLESPVMNSPTLRRSAFFFPDIPDSKYGSDTQTSLR